MRITIISPPPDLSGGQRVIATYADRLKRRGHRVVVIARPKKPLSTWQKLRIFLQQGHWPGFNEPSHFGQLKVECQQLDCYRPVTDDDVPDADIVIATWWETAEWVAKLSPRKGTKIYFIQHHEVFDTPNADRVEATWRLPLHKITISRWLVDLACDRYNDGKVDLIHNSVDLEQFHAAPRGKQPKPTVGLLYSSHPMKGCEVSLRAFNHISRLIPDVQLVAFSIQAVNPGLPLPPGTQFWKRPAPNTIRDIYAKCDVWLCGSRTEGFHLPPLEAMACRCPVVSTRVGGPVDIIEEGINGYLVDVGDDVGLAERVVDVLRMSEQKWRAMSDAAYATAARYTWDDATDLFEQALKAAAEKELPGDSRKEVNQYPNQN